jgi:hypothetical protein
LPVFIAPTKTGGDFSAAKIAARLPLLPVAETVSGRGITGGGSGYAALLEHAEGALYGTELGSVTLKRIGFFCFPIKHSTHTRFELELGRGSTVSVVY